MTKSIPISDPFSWLVAPRDSSTLRRNGDFLESATGLKYNVIDGIADLLERDLIDDELHHEMMAFSDLPYAKQCYFRNILFDQVMLVLKACLGHCSSPTTCVELGGGEGHFALAFHKAFADSRAYTCDVSLKQLENASTEVSRVRCDVRRPFLARGSVDVAAFWVSLHHFNDRDRLIALQQAKRILATDGILLIFEPNHAFLPRRLLFKKPFKDYIYFDEEEKGLLYPILSRELTNIGYEEIYVTPHNPPYNNGFLKALKLWPLLKFGAESLFMLERILTLGKKPWWIQEDGALTESKHSSLGLGTYLFSLWRNPG